MILSASLLIQTASADTGASVRPSSSAETVHPGEALRQRLGKTLPRAAEMVIVYGIAAHHSKVEWSVVAWRTEHGEWRIDKAGEEVSYFPPPPGSPPGRPAPQKLPEQSMTLSPDVGRQLDALLSDRTLYSERDQAPAMDRAPPIGGFSSEMEIVSPVGRRRVGWYGRLLGKAGEVADIVIGPG